MTTCARPSFFMGRKRVIPCCHGVENVSSERLEGQPSSPDTPAKARVQRGTLGVGAFHLGNRSQKNNTKTLDNALNVYYINSIG